MSDTGGHPLWAPDWAALTKASTSKYKITAQLVVNEYRRQQAEAGIVEVKRDDIQGAMAVLLGVASSDGTNADSAYHLMHDLHAALGPLPRSHPPEPQHPDRHPEQDQ